MKKIIYYLKKIPLYWCLLWLFFYCSFGALGFPIAKQTFGIFRPNTQPLLQAALTASVFYFLYQSRLKRWFLWFIIPYFLISWLYLPQAIMYGGISPSIIASLFETNSAESWEYIQSFPKPVYLIWFIYLLLFIFLLKKGVIQAAGSRQQAAGSRQQAAGSRQQAAGSNYIITTI